MQPCLFLMYGLNLRASERLVVVQYTRLHPVQWAQVQSLVLELDPML